MVLVRVLQRDRTNRIYSIQIYRKRFIMRDRLT